MPSDRIFQFLNTTPEDQRCGIDGIPFPPCSHNIVRLTFSNGHVAIMFHNHVANWMENSLERLARFLVLDMKRVNTIVYSTPWKLALAKTPNFKTKMTVALTHENMHKMTAYRKEKIAQKQAEWMQRAAKAAAEGKKPMGRPPKNRAVVLGLEEPTYQKTTSKSVKKDGDKATMGRPRKYPGGYKAHMKEQRRLAKLAKDEAVQNEADQVIKELQHSQEWQSNWLSANGLSDTIMDPIHGDGFDLQEMENMM